MHYGGFIGESRISKFIKNINAINATTVPPFTRGSGIVLLGVSSAETDQPIRILCGLEARSSAISSFGGTCHAGEEPLRCAIRETIEEIFCIEPSQEELDAVVKYLKEDSQLKYIYFINTQIPTYIMDVSILGNIIDKMHEAAPQKLVNRYLFENYVHSGYFTPSGPSVEYTNKLVPSKGKTIKLPHFMNTRDEYLASQAYNHPSTQKANKEIIFLSFPRLKQLQKSPTNYDIFNSVTNQREIHRYRQFFEILLNDIYTTYPALLT